MSLPLIPKNSMNNGMLLLKFELFPSYENKLKNIMLLPIRLIIVFMLTYESNPLLLYRFSHTVVFLGLAATCGININLLEGWWGLYAILPCSIFIIHLILNCFQFYKRRYGLVYGILCYLTSLSLVFFISQLIKDYILFLSFYLQ